MPQNNEKKVGDNERYAFGGKFDLDREIGNGNISAEAGEFISRWPIAEDILRNQYESALKESFEYDGYTYIHTVQMLNLVAGLTDAEFASITEAIKVPGEKDERFAFEEADFRDIFLGSIVFHDWGKAKVDINVLNYPGSLNSFRRNTIIRHPIGTADVVISRIFDGIDSNIGLGDLLDENRRLRESNNEASYLLDEIDKLIAVGKARALVENTLSGEPVDLQSQYFTEAIRAISKVNPSVIWKLGGGMKDVSKVLAIENEDLIAASVNKLKKILDGFLEEDIDLGASVDIILKKNSREAEELKVEMQTVVATNADERSNIAISLKARVEAIVNDIKEANRGIMEEMQAEIKEPINDILIGGGHPEAKKLLQMVYIAASHHYSGNKYPSLEDMSRVLPDYETWLESSGREQAIVLEIFDVADAIFSERSYKKPRDVEDTRDALVRSFLCKKNSEERDPNLKKYEKIIQYVLGHWKEMQGAGAYTKARMAIERERKSTKKD